VAAVTPVVDEPARHPSAPADVIRRCQGCGYALLDELISVCPNCGRAMTSDLAAAPASGRAAAVGLQPVRDHQSQVLRAVIAAVVLAVLVGLIVVVIAG
jgi:hypothetical protein